MAGIAVRLSTQWAALNHLVTCSVYIVSNLSFLCVHISGQSMKHINKNNPAVHTRIAPPTVLLPYLNIERNWTRLLCNQLSEVLLKEDGGIILSSFWKHRLSRGSLSPVTFIFQVTRGWGWGAGWLSVCCRRPGQKNAFYPSGGKCVVLGIVLLDDSGTLSSFLSW